MALVNSTTDIILKRNLG